MPKKTAQKTTSNAIRNSASFKTWAKKWKLDEDEQEVLAAFEAGELKPVADQKKAAIEGLPYQTLAASIIHKYVH